jgi:hypothetical protein
LTTIQSLTTLFAWPLADQEEIVLCSPIPDPS